MTFRLWRCFIFAVISGNCKSEGRVSCKSRPYFLIWREKESWEGAADDVAVCWDSIKLGEPPCHQISFGSISYPTFVPDWLPINIGHYLATFGLLQNADLYQKRFERIANAVQCQSWLSGNYDCHDLKFSIVSFFHFPVVSLVQKVIFVKIVKIVKTSS